MPVCSITFNRENQKKMAIQYKFFAVPVNHAADVEAELNAFLNTIRLIDVRKEIIHQDGRACWAVAVEYATGEAASVNNGASLKKRIDYKDELSPEDFAVFAKLRDWRKAVAGKEAVQLYTVFTNDQLAAMVEKKITSKNSLREINGIGDARIEKYGDAVVSMLRNAFEKPGGNNETGEQPVPADPGV